MWIRSNKNVMILHISSCVREVFFIKNSDKCSAATSLSLFSPWYEVFFCFFKRKEEEKAHSNKGISKMYSRTTQERIFLSVSLRCYCPLKEKRKNVMKFKRTFEKRKNIQTKVKTFKSSIFFECFGNFRSIVTTKFITILS